MPHSFNKVWIHAIRATKERQPLISVDNSINEQDLILKKFAWQKGYAAYSVSESQLEKVFQYIKNQKHHHQKKTFEEEYEEIMKLHGVIEISIHGDPS